MTIGGRVLTRAESEVAGFAAQGHSNREIGVRLFVTEKTVKFHLNNIYKKFGVKSRSQFIVKMNSGLPPILDSHASLADLKQLKAALDRKLSNVERELSTALMLIKTTSLKIRTIIEASELVEKQEAPKVVEDESFKLPGRCLDVAQDTEQSND